MRRSALLDYLTLRLPLRPNPQPLPVPAPPYLSLTWCRELGRRFLSPERPQLDRARAVASRFRRQNVDARAAWEAMIGEGLLPMSFADDPARRFVQEPVDQGMLESNSMRLLAAPQTVEAAVTVASDLEGVVAAEAAGAEWLARLHSFERPARARSGGGDHDGAEGVAWRILPNVQGIDSLTHVATDVGAALEKASMRLHTLDEESAFLDGATERWPNAGRRLRARIEARENPSAPAPDEPEGADEIPRVGMLLALGALRAALLWSAAARLDLRVPASQFWTARVKGRPVRVADELDPHQALLAVLWRGYLVQRPSGGRLVLAGRPSDPGRMSRMFHKVPA